MNTDPLYKPRNRHKRLLPRSRSSWCTQCDAAHVHDGERCSNCGSRNSTVRLKLNRRNATLLG